MRGRYRSPISPLPTGMHSLPCYQHPYQGGAFGTVGEPILPHRHHPKPRVYLRLHSCCCTFYGFGQICSDMYPSLWNHAEYFHYPKNPVCSACSSPPPQAWPPFYCLFTFYWRSFYCLHNFALPRMSYSWNHTV